MMGSAGVALHDDRPLEVSAMRPFAMLFVVLLTGCSAGDASRAKGPIGGEGGEGGVTADGSTSGTGGYRPYGSGGNGGVSDAPYNPYYGVVGGSGGKSDLVGGEWTATANNLTSLASECGNLGVVSAKPDTDMLIAGVAKEGLWSSADGGKTWTQLGTGAGSDKITNRPTMIVYDPTDPNTFWEAGIYNGGGVYKTADNGVTWKQLGTVTHTDSIAIDFSDPARMTLLAGGHESAQKLWRSTDGGLTWTNVGLNLPTTSSFSSNAVVFDAQTHVVGCSGYAGTYGIFRTTDGGTSWASMSTLGPSPAPLVASDGSVWWTIIYSNGIVRSVNQGASFTQPTSQYNALADVKPIELPDHRIAAVSGYEQNKATRIVVGTDGKSWKTVGAQIPINPISLTYSTQRKAFYVSYFTCNAGNVPVDAVMTMPFDYETAK
jgi:photosystem II stability/assembly factor-like uncharacterized protein